MKRVLKALGVLAAVFVGLVVLGAAAFYLSVRAKELPLTSAGEFIPLEPGDVVLRAYTGVRWLDSERYFLIQADPAGFDERIARLSKVGPDQTARVIPQPPREMWYRSEIPKWWDVDALPDAVALDIGSTQHNHSGSFSIFSKQRGLIYVVDR